MDTSITPRISPVLDPETMMALMLRYCEVHEEVAYQYARALFCRLSADVGPYEVTQLARDIVTEVTNDIGIFEGGGGGEPDRRRAAAADRPRQGRRRVHDHAGRLSRLTGSPGPA